MSCHSIPKRIILSALVILGACTPVAPPATSPAQEPASTTFDGHYPGTATLTREGYSGKDTACYSLKAVDMTITGGQVVIQSNMVDLNKQTSLPRALSKRREKYRPLANVLAGK